MEELKKLIGKEYKSNFTWIQGIGRIIAPKIIINSITPKGYANITVNYTGCKSDLTGEIVNGTYHIKKAKLLHKNFYNGQYDIYLDYRSSKDLTSIQCFSYGN